MKSNFKYYLKSGCSSCDKILKSLNLNKNDEVIVPVTLCQSVIDVIIKNKLKPVFVDVNDNFLIIKKEIDKHITNKTKVIIFVEQYGHFIEDKETYHNNKGERIIKVLDSCQNGIKRFDYNFDFVFYSFNKRKPIDLNGYSLLISSKKLNIKSNVSYKIKLLLIINLVIYNIRILKRIIIKNIIDNNIQIPGHLVECKNYSYYRIVYIMDVNKREFTKIDDRIYEYMDDNDLDILQTTIEQTPYEKLGVKDNFKNFNKLRYKAIYFRSDNNILNYYKIINKLNMIWGDIHEK